MPGQLTQAGMFTQIAAAIVLALQVPMAIAQDHHHHSDDFDFSIRSKQNGAWSDKQTWESQRVPKQGDRVLISSGTTVGYDVKSKEVIRLVQVVGTLKFAVDRDTELNVGLLTIQHQSECSEHGFACEFEGSKDGPKTSAENWPALIIGTVEHPIPADHTARIRLHHLKGMDANDAPAIACCSGRMELHGSPLARTWIKLGANVAAGRTDVKLS
ncbi:MAG TPA: hypothetical protein EYG03_22945, partial [Planctomycetes bacterium]|nr:hypothetical protein [Planctomycetota bacterium]